MVTSITTDNPLITDSIIGTIIITTTIGINNDLILDTIGVDIIGAMTLGLLRSPRLVNK